MHLQGLLQLLRAGFCLLDLGEAGRAVAGHFLKEVVDLLCGARDGLALGIQRRRLRPQAGQPVGQFLTAAVKRAAAELTLIALGTKPGERLLRRKRVGTGGRDAVLICLLLRAAGVDGRILPRDGLLRGVFQQRDLRRLGLRLVQRLDRLLQLRLRSVELRVRGVECRLRVLKLGLALFFLQRERIQRCAQALELICAREDAAALGGAAAGE